MRVETERKMKRWREQRWLLDQVIQTRGLDWDQGRTGKILAQLRSRRARGRSGDQPPGTKVCRYPP